MNVKRLVLYIFINAIVSAAVALGVLWLWQQTHPLLPLPATAVVAQLSPTAPAQAATPTAPVPAASQAAAPTPTVYVVQPGDTLGSIAQHFGVTIDEIIAANNISNANLVSAGQSLVIPVPGSVPPTAPPSTPSLPPTNPPQTPLATSTLDPNQPLPAVTIRSVSGAGSLADEVLVVANDGGPVDLAGWTLRDESGHQYTFPTLKLLKSGTVNLHTTAGSDTGADLYWGQAVAVWASGKSALLSDQGGSLRARYQVP
jgi:LysM repeat protein